MENKQSDKAEVNQVNDPQENQTDTACDPGYHKDNNGNCVKDGGNDTHPIPNVPTKGV